MNTNQIDDQLLKVLMENYKDAPEMLSPEYIKDSWELSRDAVYQLFKSKSFPGIVIGSRIRVHKVSLVAWLVSLGSRGEQVIIN